MLRNYDSPGAEKLVAALVTLPVARRNFAALGASEPRVGPFVRPAREDEKPPAPPASV
jgi:hypothetical protein